MKYVKFYTLGCKVNLYETESMKELFRDRGYTVTEDEYADVFVINTCTVTAVGDKKSRQMIRRAKKQNPDAVVAVVGCYSQVSPEKVAELPEVDIILGTYGRKNIVNYVEQYNGGKINAVTADIPAVFEELAACEQSRTRATVKIQDGCRSFCSYCIIPYARGPLRSREPQSVISEVKSLCQKGFIEFVLVGINLACYSSGGMRLVDIIREICKIPEVKRVRLGSLEPNIFNNDFFDLIKTEDKLCRHFHISLQSGCTKTLQRMNRRYTAEEYLGCLERIRSVAPGVNITTDIMVGFPGETEEEFAQSQETVIKAQFGHMHVFPYSKRSGTPAAVMPEQVTEAVKAQRVARMLEIGKIMTLKQLSGLVGETAEVLFEQPSEHGGFEGFTENYYRVVCDGADMAGEIKNVRIIRTDGECLFGVPAQKIQQGV